MKEYVRDEFERRRHVTDIDKIKWYITQGKKGLKQLQGMVDLSLGR